MLVLEVPRRVTVPVTGSQRVQAHSSIDPVILFHTSQAQQARGTLVHLQRRALTMEVYSPALVIQLSEVLGELAIRSRDKVLYRGRAAVNSLVNTSLMTVVSVTLLDEWLDLSSIRGEPALVKSQAQRFVDEWDERFRVNRSYQVVISEFRAFLAEAARWLDQADATESLPLHGDGRVEETVFYDLAAPFMERGARYLRWLEDEGVSVPAEHAAAHRAFAQAALHPLMLRAPFVFRTFTKPLGYAGDYGMVNQIIEDPRQGPSTYFQVVNAMFLHAPVAQAHRNRIDILLARLGGTARAAGDCTASVLNVGCGPAIEIQRFIATDPQPQRLRFTLVDFSEETLNYARSRIEEACRVHGKTVQVDYVQESVLELVKRGAARSRLDERSFDLVYCAGLFDYLSDKVCARLLLFFTALAKPRGRVLVTNVHSVNPQRVLMEHLLEWYLVYRNERELEAVLPAARADTAVYTDATGANVFAEFTVKDGAG